MIFTEKDGSRWADKCDLCKSTRYIGEYGRSIPCTWCRAVRDRYGDYFYPIDDSNKHLFENKPEPEPVWKQYMREQIEKEMEVWKTQIRKSAIVPSPQFNLYFGSSEDGRGTPQYKGRTQDFNVALQHLKRIEKNPYTFGHVTVQSDTSEEYFTSSENLEAEYGPK